MSVSHQIPHFAYLDPAILKAEIDQIFLAEWQPVAMVFDLPNDNDFVLRQVGGKEVVIQNFAGQLRAFTNVCSHRFARIQTACKGNRPLRCPYHSWHFNAEGIPANIPRRADYSCLAEVPAEDLALERWHLAVCGQLIFISLKQPQHALRDFLGNLYPHIEAITQQLGHEMPSNESIIQANWKLLAQNTLEFQHVFSVHPQTFGSMTPSPPSLQDMEAPAPHIHYVASLKESPNQGRVEAILAKNFSQPMAAMPPGHKHILVFPCFTIGQNNGTMFFLFQYHPEAPGRTRFSCRQWFTKPAANDPLTTSKCQALIDQMVPEVLRFVDQLNAEDADICESVQRALRSVPDHWPMRLADSENLVARYQAHYLAVMGGVAALEAIQRADTER